MVTSQADDLKAGQGQGTQAFQHPTAVWPPVNIVTEKNQRSRKARIVACILLNLGQQIVQKVEATVNISHSVYALASRHSRQRLLLPE
jgi:hypothetical protein